MDQCLCNLEWYVLSNSIECSIGHNSSAYNPISWKVWGSHSQSIYYLIDAQSGMKQEESELVPRYHF